MARWSLDLHMSGDKRNQAYPLRLIATCLYIEFAVRRVIPKLRYLTNAVLKVCRVPIYDL
jgi:hypothetical protein